MLQTIFRFYLVQSRAYFCINNMLSNLPLELLEDYEGVYSIWAKTGEFLLKKGHMKTDVDDLYESATAVLRTVLSRYNLKNKRDLPRIRQLFENVQKSDIQVRKKYPYYIF